MSVGSKQGTVAGPDGLSLSLEQAIRYEYSAPVSDLRQRLVVIPPVMHGAQRRCDWGIRIDGVAQARTRSRVEAFGNHVVRVVVPRVEESVTFTVWSEVEIAGTRDAADHLARRDLRWLRATRLTEAGDRVRQLAGQLSARPDAAEISAAARASLTYEWGITGVHTTADDALAEGHGVCQDFAHVMLALCRLVGMPARYVSGHLLGEGGSHAWVEVLTRGPSANIGRVEAWDPTHDRRADAGYITVATGRDYTDVAPMSGSYSGRAEGRLSVRKHAQVLTPSDALAALAG